VNIADNFEDVDAFYARLVTIHESLDDDESEQFNLALILILANHIGEAAALEELLRLAEDSLRDESGGDGEGDGDDGDGDGGDGD